MLRLFGIATLLLRPAVWLMVGAAFMGGVAYERGAGQDRCQVAGGDWRSGLCAGVAR